MKLSAWKMFIIHVLCIGALMWTGLLNGQPFFFSDTSNYVRAADAAVHLVSSGQVSTEWTDRYREALPGSRNSAAPADATLPRSVTHNDVSNGLIMSGRSPYIGALMFLGYVTSKFWLFIALQAAIAYALIALSLRRFGVYNVKNVVMTTLLLSLTTSLPTYNSLLLADAFASFGILSFLLLSSPGRISRLELLFLLSILLISVISHLTHTVMLGAMLLMLALLSLTKWALPVPRIGWAAGVGGVLLGFASIHVTAAATEAALGSKPQLLPLLTARFIADGPGKAFIDQGCEGGRFQVCRVHIGEPRSAGAILSGTDPSTGTYLLASPEQRRRMGEEDVAFAVAVFKAYPVQQSYMILRNTLTQLSWIDYDGLNQGCFSRVDCYQALPGNVRDDLKASLSGRNAWPQREMNIILYVSVVLSLATIALLSRILYIVRPGAFSLFRMWLLLAGAAMLFCSIFGGAVVEPQYRYQGRLIWLVPLMALLSFLVHRQLSPKPSPIRRANPALRSSADT